MTKRFSSMTLAIVILLSIISLAPGALAASYTLSVSYHANGGTISSDTYKKANSDLVYTKSDNSLYVQKWTYNEPKTNGLNNASTFGLERAGYTFSGWGTTPSGGKVFDQSDTALKPSEINPDVAKKDCATTLYAIWTPNTLSVSYHANGGTISSDTYKKANSDLVYTKSGNKQYVQKWTYNEPRTNGLINVSTFGLTRDGYKFSGWGTSANGGKILSQSSTDLRPTDITADISSGSCSITLYAIWVADANSYVVRFNSNGGSGAPGEHTKVHDVSLTLSNVVPERPGYTFLGWSSNSSATTAQFKAGGSYTANASVTLYAVWSPNTLSISYHANGGTITSDTYKKANSDLIYIKSNNSKYVQVWKYNEQKANGLNNASTFGLTKAGYKFAGWGTTASGGKVLDQNKIDLRPTDITSDISAGSSSITLYAIWVPDVVEYTITYSANGGSGAPSSQTKTEGSTLTLSSNTPVRSGYTFLGWSTNNSATTAQFKAGGSYTANASVKLYAVWKKIPSAYDVQDALAYAKNNVGNDLSQKCAEFVSRCLDAGGVHVINKRVEPLLNALEKTGLGERIELQVESSGAILFSNNKDSISVGDPIFIYCPNCAKEDGLPWTHVVLVSEAEKEIKVYAHNSTYNNKIYYGFNSCGYYGHGYNSNIKAYSYHFN